MKKSDCRTGQLVTYYPTDARSAAKTATVLDVEGTLNGGVRIKMDGAHGFEGDVGAWHLEPR